MRTTSRICGAVLGLLMFGLAACGSSGTVPDEVAAAFDVSGNWVADLTEPTDEQFDPQVVLSAIGQARSVGTDLRVVVVGSQDQLLPADDVRAIVNEYGGSVLVFKANDEVFIADSADLNSDQVARAIENASGQPTIAASVSGFVRTISEEGVGGGSIFDTLLRWVFLPLCALFFLFMLIRYIKARQLASKRINKFEERKRSLADWAGQLPGEIDQLRGVVALSNDESRATLQELEDFSAGISPKIAVAESSAELDGAEMRLGRAFIKLRDLRAAVGA